MIHQLNNNFTSRAWYVSQSNKRNVVTSFFNFLSQLFCWLIHHFSIMKNYIYIRISSAGQSNFSLDQQKSACRQMLPAGIDNSNICIVQDIASGGSLSGRAGICNILANYNPGDKLYAYQLSRIARNASDAVQVYDVFGGNIQTTEGAFVGPNGRFMYLILAAAAELELHKIHSRAVASIRTRSNIYLDYLRPYKRLFSMPGTLREIAQILTIQEVRTPTGNIRWHPQQVKRVQSQLTTLAANN